MLKRAGVFVLTLFTAGALFHPAKANAQNVFAGGPNGAVYVEHHDHDRHWRDRDNWRDRDDWRDRNRERRWREHEWREHERREYRRGWSANYYSTPNYYYSNPNNYYGSGYYYQAPDPYCNR